MPSKFGIRARLGLKAETKPLSQHPITAPPNSSADPAPPNSRINNHAFQLALEQHIQNLKPDEKAQFTKAQSIQPDDLLRKVESLHTEDGHKTTPRRYRDQLSKFLELCNRSTNLVAIGVQTSLEASLIVGAVKLVIESALNFLTFFGKIADMFNAFGDHLGYIEEYAKTCDRADLPKVEKAVVAIYGDLLEFCRRARLVFLNPDGTHKKFQSIRTFIRVQWEPFEAKFGTIQSDLDRHASVLEKAAVAEMLANAYDQKKSAEEDERRQIMEWLSQIDIENVHDRIFKDKHNGTAEWLFQEPLFVEWVNAPQSTLLWCFGGPGIGKSVLASNALEHLTQLYGMDERIGIAYMYCRHDAPRKERSASSMFALFTKQLIWKTRQLPNVVRHFGNEYIRDARVPSLEKYVGIFLDMSTNFDKIFLVLDGLDECDMNERKSVIQSCQHVLTASQSYRIFVSSRREYDIEQELLRLDVPMIHIEPQTTKADIEVFVREEADKLIKNHELRLQNEDLKQDIINALVDESDGMFLWAKLQLQSICNERRDQDILKALKSLPKTMQETYQRIESQIEQRPANLRQLAKESLTWVLYSKRRLNEYELCEAVSFSPSTEPQPVLQHYTLRDIFDSCANLLYQEDGFLRPIHYSVKEYFVHTPCRTPKVVPSAVYHLGEAHAYLAATCLSYLLNEGLDKSVCKDVHELVFERVCKLPLCYYAAWYFDEHLVEGDHSMRDLDELLCALLCSSSIRLATVLQLRNLQILDFEPRRISYTQHFETGFVGINGEVNEADLICTTKLYGFRSPYLVQCQAQFGTFESLSSSKLALHWACAAGSEQIVRRLLLASGGEAVEDGNGIEPLYYAAQKGSDDICKILLRNKHDPNHSGGSFSNALQAASYRGHNKVVQTLIDAGAEVNAQGGEFGNALQAASYWGHDKVVQALLDAGAEVNAQGGEYGNALQAASFIGNEKVVQILIDAGAEVNAQGGKYGNALEAALFGDEKKVVQMLIDAGAGVNAQGGKYGNALQAASFRGDEKVVQMLINMGAEVNAQGGEFGNALQAASYMGRENVVQILIDAGAEVNAQGGEFGNALQAASFGGAEKVVQMLINAGAEVNAQCGEYGNALQAASYMGRENVVQILIDAGAEVNAQGGEYGNALQAASFGGAEKVVQMLINAGAEVNAQGGEHGNALRAASIMGKEKVVRMLTDAGALQSVELT